MTEKTQMQRTQELRDQLAVLHGLELREGWDVLECWDCPCWFRGDVQVVAQHLYQPERVDFVIRMLREVPNFTLLNKGHTFLVCDGEHVGEDPVFDHAFLLYLIDKETKNAKKHGVNAG